MKKQAFINVPGSDPNATMKGDRMQAMVPGGAKPGSKPKKPPTVKKGGQFNLSRRR
jgi:hypothetical protein